MIVRSFSSCHCCTRFDEKWEPLSGRRSLIRSHVVAVEDSGSHIQAIFKGGHFRRSEEQGTPPLLAPEFFDFPLPNGR